MRNEYLANIPNFTQQLNSRVCLCSGLSEKYFIMSTILDICLLSIVIVHLLKFLLSFSLLCLSSFMLASWFKFHINFLDTL